MDGMETADRVATETVVEKLFKYSYSFEYLQSIRILKAWYKKASFNTTNPLLPHQQWRVQFNVSFGGSSTEVSKITVQKTPFEQANITVNFAGGIAGLNSPLPRPYTEWIVDRALKKDFVSRDFLDIFNHRFAWQFYKLRSLWEPGTTDRPAEDSFIGQSLYDLMGVDLKIFHKASTFSYQSMLPYVSFFWKKPRDLYGLKKILEGYFKTSIDIKAFQGHWCPIEKEQITHIGTGKGQLNALGTESALGTKFWDQAAGIRIQIGPMDWVNFRKFIPTGPENKILKEIVLLFLGPMIKVNYMAKINSKSVRFPSLGKNTCRLGYTSWLKSRFSSKVTTEIRI